MLSALLLPAFTFPLLLLAMALTVLFPCLLTFDALVRREHDLYLAQWEADGRPQGMFWRTERARYSLASFRSGFATQKCMFVWLFVTPYWIEHDEEARRLLRRVRWLTLAWNVGMLLLVFLFLVFRIASK